MYFSPLDLRVVHSLVQWQRAGDVVARYGGEEFLSVLPGCHLSNALQVAERMRAHPKTVKTLINRLLNKGAIKFKEENRKYLYYPVVKKKDFYGVKTESFLNKFFDGELSPLVSFFSSHKKLTTSEIAQIRKLLDEQEAGHDE